MNLELLKPCPDCKQVREFLAAADEEMQRKIELPRCKLISLIPTTWGETLHCPTCKDKGFIPTDLGQQVLDFILFYGPAAAGREP